MRFSTRSPVGEQPWIKWFAWYPVVTGETNEYSWLEYVERKKLYEFAHSNSYFYIHRNIEKENK